MTLDELLLELRERRLLLISESEVWPSPRYTRMLQRAVRKHRGALALLMRWSSIDVCPARDLHRRYYRYIGNGCFVCALCQQLEAFINAKKKRSA